MNETLTDKELARKALIKIVRNQVRLAYSVKADAKLNEILPRVVADFDKAMGIGKSFKLATASILADVDDEV